MIGRLRGVLLQKSAPHLLLDVSGVGYELEAPMTTFYDLPAVGEAVTLYTHLVVRDDAHLLYGFSRNAQRRLFRRLLKVNGVGPRVALAILSGLSDQEFLRCVASEDIARLTKVPGIGRKTAERVAR
jgi:Holliday junction DNA helicase RuvA